jgi:hypothetical protein
MLIPFTRARFTVLFVLAVVGTVCAAAAALLANESLAECGE